jgi:hypothetical protein
MSISELGALGEFIASIGVLATLIILVFELRRNTKLQLRSNSRQAYIQNGDALQALLDPEVSELFLRGNNEGLSSLTPEERYRFDIAYVLWLISCEQAYSDYREGLFPLDQWEAFENSISGWLTTPGGSEWWRERNVWFGRMFRIEIDSMLENPKQEAQRAGPKPRK